jgi:hypothetical protein
MQSIKKLLKLTLNSAFHKSAPPNGQPAKKIPNASLLSKIAKRCAESQLAAGFPAFPRRVARQLLTLLNVRRLISA